MSIPLFLTSSKPASTLPRVGHWKETVSSAESVLAKLLAGVDELGGDAAEAGGLTAAVFVAVAGALAAVAGAGLVTTLVDDTGRTTTCFFRRRHAYDLSSFDEIWVFDIVPTRNISPALSVVHTNTDQCVA